MYTIEELDLRQLIKVSLTVLETFGYIRPDFQNTPKIIVYYIYSFICLGFLLIMFVISETINMILIFGDMEKMSEGSFLFLTHVVQTGKVYLVVLNITKIRKLINDMNREEFRPRNQTQFEMLASDIKISQRMTSFFLFCGFVTCMLWGIFPLLDTSDGNQKSIKLPLSAWIPFDTTKSPIFEYSYVYLIFAATIDGLANISLDTFLSGIIMTMAGQLRLLNHSFEELKRNLDALPENEKQNNLKLREDFIQNIIHHKAILQYSEDFTDLFTNCIMVQFVVSVVLICITMFQMSLVSVVSLQFFSMALYELCALLEIFLWCYYGNEVIVESEKLTMSAYMSDWIDALPDFKQDLLFFMTRTQIPLKLYAGGYFELSLTTFMAIIKSSWSYFAVLNSMHDKEA